jgi:choline dehydrogenase-like flavoprotein
MNINGDAIKQNTYDAIVIGSGISGGWAAKELCEKGLRTLVLERGRDVKHVVDYPTATLNPWEFQHRNKLPDTFRKENPVATKCYALDEATQQFFVKDAEHPYVQEKPFDWIRGYQVGGKSLLWARQTQRWSRFDFEANARDGAAIDWPIRYADIAPWYSHVEKFVGISGNKDGLETLPDGEFLKPWELNCVEKHIQKRVAESYKDRHVIIGRCAHLTDPQPIHYEQGRAQCQARHLCYRGCPYGGYFSSNSSTIPWAAKTGKLTLRPDSVVHSIIYDDVKGKATGVRVIDTHTKQMTDYFARIIFVNAACLNTNLILLNSTSRRFSNGLGNDNGLLGRYVAFHNYRGNITASYEGFADGYYYGRRPTTAFMPNFRNVNKQETSGPAARFQRGYMVAFSASRSGWQRGAGQEGFGADFKDKLSDPGNWSVFMMMQAETVPRYENHVRLSTDQKDPWGIPQLVTSIDYTDNDLKVMNDFLEQGAEMLDKAGCKNINPYDDHRNPGLDIHEVGGVRMGRDPKTSLLNAHNQLHAVKNVFVTDGAAMTSTGTQNPSITFMALTARAANYAVAELKKGNL